MKRQNLLLTALIATVSICLPMLSNANLRPANAELSTPLLLTVTNKVAAATVLASGAFEKSEHPTSGTAQIIVKNGKKYLKFDDGFKSDSGPDLFVILHRQDSPKSYAKANYVNLGRLKKVSGQQVYSIPSGVDVAQFKSVAIWCRKFNATFGFAQLN
ncbi:DM13 domain-containing protein [Chamaesiphon sp. VAR_48_metabat_403]|uniref:DM13 domain-containing protein n=1 Tax=Chamaesiphon sp. VAR_48_metabat_403 TaxID=2964700 RepID=UPI00286E2AC8|nr:DM13 domain-containing protein [Chamaesiphon sp. VAR_48_metabat_403]